MSNSTTFYSFIIFFLAIHSEPTDLVIKMINPIQKGNQMITNSIYISLGKTIGNNVHLMDLSKKNYVDSDSSIDSVYLRVHEQIQIKFPFDLTIAYYDKSVSIDKPITIDCDDSGVALNMNFIYSNESTVATMIFRPNVFSKTPQLWLKVKTKLTKANEIMIEAKCVYYGGRVLESLLYHNQDLPQLFCLRSSFPEPDEKLKKVHFIKAQNFKNKNTMSLRLIDYVVTFNQNEIGSFFFPIDSKIDFSFDKKKLQFVLSKGKNLLV